MVPALCMQSAVHQQMRVMRRQRLALLLGLARDHWGAQHQVGHHHRFLRIVERQHIGGVVLLAVTLVQLAAFFFTHDAHRDFGVIGQGMADGAEITVRIVGEEEGRELNKSYRKKDYATNVLTFDYAQEPVVVADLVLCAPVVAREAKEQGKTLAAHYAHLLVHGTLHAQGWDHETSEVDAEEMEAYEVAILAGLGLKNPYR